MRRRPSIRGTHMKRKLLLIGQVALLTCATGLVQAAEIQATRTVRNVDMATAGVGGIDTGTGSIALGGVGGSVKKAYLYWYGINGAGAYNRSAISFGGQPVTGRALGASGTNCWGAGQQCLRGRRHRAGDGQWQLQRLGAGIGQQRARGRRIAGGALQRRQCRQ